MSNHKPNILVFGDWYVDAHWVVAPHDSSTASRPGEMQSLAVHDVDATVRALCGAGQVASLLARASDGTVGQVHGLGKWAVGDDPFIQALMKGLNESDNPLRLQSRITPVCFKGEQEHPGAVIQDRCVYNIAVSESTGTNRVIRVYRKSSSHAYRLVERIDFATRDDDLRSTDSLQAIDKLPQSDQISCVLVKDHGHGVVTPELVRALADRYPSAAWYVCTKRWQQWRVPGGRQSSLADDAWLAELNNLNVRLVLFQQEATSRATTPDTTFPEVGSWFVGSIVPTWNAIQAIDLVRGQDVNATPPEPTPPQPAVAVLPARESAIAWFPPESGKPPRGFAFCGSTEEPHERFVPHASALFAALVFEDLKEPRGRTWVEKMRAALSFTSRWVRGEATRLTDPKWKGNDTTLGGVGTEPQLGNDFDWAHVRNEYVQAFSWAPKDAGGQTIGVGCGLIQRKTELYLDTWRAKSDLESAVSIVRAKRHMLGQLGLEFDHFIRTGMVRHRSYMIVDDPGGGKSTLVRGLASARNMRVLPVNITELTRRVDLLAFFDTVVTTQAQDPEKPVVVFVDEINALLEGHTAYSAFLAPLEDGHYNRDGKSFIIRPCIWVFVGTEGPEGNYQRHHAATSRGFQLLRDRVDRVLDPSTPDLSVSSGHGEHSRAFNLDRAQKKSDFLSRLSLPPFLLNQPIPPLESSRELATELSECLATLGYGDILLDYSWFAGLSVTESTKATRSDLSGPEKELLRRVKSAMKSSESPVARETLALRLIGRHLLRRGRALERIYVGAELITKLHADVDSISQRVLRAFAALPEGFTYRDLRHDLEAMTNIQRGEVKWANLPRRFQQHVGTKWFEIDLCSLEPGHTWHVPLCELPAEPDKMVRIVRDVPTDGSWREPD